MATPAQRRALARAARRPGGNLCPMPYPAGAGAAAEALLASLARRGWSDGAPCPLITPAGRAAIARTATTGETP